MIICTIFEKTLSEGTDVATMQCLPTITLTNMLAFKSGSRLTVYLVCTTLAIFGACLLFLFSHNGMSLSSHVISRMYMYIYTLPSKSLEMLLKSGVLDNISINTNKKRLTFLNFEFLSI